MSSDKNFAATFVAIIGGLTVLAIVLFFVAGMLTEEISNHKPDDVVRNNIRPVGEVNIASASEPAADISSSVAPTPAASPRQIYQTSCFSCHGTGAAGAPKVGDATAWASRIAKGMDAMLDNAISGINAMPPKGLCMTCSDDELRAVIEYMIEQSR